MAKRLIALLSTMLISLIAFSQTGTDKICFPVETAKKIAVDLARGDSAIAELTLTKEVLKTTEEVVVQKDNIINTYKEKVDNFSKQIVAYKAKEFQYQDMVTGLESDNKKLNRKLLFSKVSTGVVGAAGLIVVLLLAL